MSKKRKESVEDCISSTELFNGICEAVRALTGSGFFGEPAPFGRGLEVVKTSALLNIASSLEAASDSLSRIDYELHVMNDLHIRDRNQD